MAGVAAMAVADLPSIGPAAITMGAFDGIHAGHAAILQATRSAAAERTVASVALVFDPHPDEVLHPGTRSARLAPLRVNLARVRELGIGHALPIRFDDHLRSLTAEQFLAALAPAIDLCTLVMSRESAFGRGRSGTATRMRVFGREENFGVVTVERVQRGGEPVSSSRVREAIVAGRFVAAREMGVAPYLEGTVVRGDQRGRELGFPTANLAFDYLPVMPPRGIYAGRAVVVGAPRAPLAPTAPALISIGTRPTFHRHGAELVEVHLLDADVDLYGQTLGVELVVRLRDERRFDGAAELVVQMQRDAEDARQILGIS
jgi:riboflavin kinase / FMN adenylyltransferase